MSRHSETTYLVEGRTWANLNGSHRHHHAHQALMQDWHDRALIAIRTTHCRPVQTPVTITATVHRTTRARADAHNVAPSIKAAIDAAVTAGLIPDDSDQYVSRTVIEPGPVAKVPSLTIHIATTKETP